MAAAGDRTLLRVFIRNTLAYSWWYTAADALLRRAIRRGLVGETTLVGVLGLDATGKIVEPGRWSLVKNRPLVLEFLDAPAAIGAFLADVVEVVSAGLATLERAHVLAARRRGETPTQIVLSAAAPNPSDYLPSLEEHPHMRQTVDGQLLRIFVDDSDQYAGRPLYRALVEKARDLGLANAVVLRAPMGFGSHRQFHSDRSPDYADELPVLVEIVGALDKVELLLPFLDEAIPEGLITLEGVKMLRLGGG